MTSNGHGTGIAGSYWSTGHILYGAESYSSVPYGGSDFNGPEACPTENLSVTKFTDPVILRNCRLTGLWDLKLDSENVRGKIIDFLNSMIDIGVAGFRIDAAKHMWPEDLDFIYGHLHDLPSIWFPEHTRPFIFQEFIELDGGECITSSEYTYLGRVTEFKYGLGLSQVIKKKDGQRLAYLRNFGEGWAFISEFNAVVFIDNQDNQRGSAVLTHRRPAEYKLAVGFMLAWDYGYTRVMSSYYFEDDDAGPPSDRHSNTNHVDCSSSDWVCEHRWRQTYNMVRFHNLVIGHNITNWWDNGFHQIAFSRGKVGFIAINNEDFLLDSMLQTGLPAGVYCDVLSCENPHPPCGGSSDCRPPITVNVDGTSQITISNMYNLVFETPMIAIHL